MHATALQPASTGADWGEASTWHWLDLKCHWRVLGQPSAPPIVLIHGFGASSSHWRHNAGALAAAGYRVFSLDLIGFGRSDQPGLNRHFSLDNRLWSRQLAAFPGLGTLGHLDFQLLATAQVLSGDTKTTRGDLLNS